LQLPRTEALSQSKGVMRPGAAPTSAPERKLYYYDDIGAAIRLGTLVHGPGASELLGYATGHGQDANSAVFACLTKVCTAYTEAQPKVYRFPRDGGSPDVLPDHPLEVLLDEPNPHLTGIELRWWTQWALKVHGNAYWRKARAGNPDTGNVVELWPISPTLVAPITSREDRRRGIFISHYRWEYETGKFEDIPLHNLVHFRAGLDDYDHRLGVSGLRRLLRQVSTDEEATRFTDSLLRNYAVPGLVAKTDADLQQQDADAIKQKLSFSFGAGQRGNVAVLDNGMDVAQFGFSPEQMNLAALHRVPEERIAAVIGIPAIIAGLGAGLERSTYSNFREAREMFTEQDILPLYVADAAVINRHLKPDFTTDRRLQVQFDIAKMRALQEDEDARYKRLTEALSKGGITLNTYLSELGFPPEPNGDIYYLPTTIKPTKPEDLAKAPDPMPLPGAADGTDDPALADGRSGQRRLPPPGDAGDDEGQEQRSLPAGQRMTKARLRLRVLEGRQGAPADDPQQQKQQAIRPRIRPEEFPAFFEAMRELAVPALRDDVQAYLDGQKRRLQARVLADWRDPATADPATARAILPSADRLQRERQEGVG